MKKLCLLVFIACLISLPAKAAEYPTEETVRFVLNCMSNLGAQNDENLYTCICRYDTIRAALSYSDYEEGVTYERNKAMPGEKGSFFRDNKRGEGFYETLLEIREKANASCPIVKRVRVDRSAAK